MPKISLTSIKLQLANNDYGSTLSSQDAPNKRFVIPYTK